MYLKASRYIGGWGHSADSEKTEFNAILAVLKLPRELVADGSPSLTVNVNVAYWRKANAIHKWFVDNVQSGEDECKEHFVERKQLAALVILCKQVLTDPAKLAPELLPPQPGFFFGTTDIDDDYRQDLKETILQLDAVLNNEALKEYEFYYRSSW